MRTGKNAGTPAAASAAGPFTVEIEGVTDPAVFARLPDALAALWTTLRALPLGAVQADAYEYFLTRPNAAQRVAEFFERDGQLTLSFAMGGRSHAVWVSPAAPGPDR
ncbi:hypothetical protein [Kitasatospora sp. MAP5-34]|uniref:hypothetical protein n=1 Tax=Kitasatospora sp. MAP5-34 TaxID=3035102 RepID=UPI0024755EA5|nr:hypothetical protein [Kitasatospora sp. MAP5-34]MDH6579828.1 hypothetical protein [Kitasatospora sp. MAP5-34]